MDDVTKTREEILEELQQLRAAHAESDAERHRLENELNSLHEVTEQRISERTRALNKSQSQLITKHEELMIMFAQVELVKKQWEKTLDCISDLVVLVDSEGKVRRCNKAVAELTGQPVGSLPGAELEKLLLGPDMEVVGPSGAELFHKPTGRWFKLASYPFVTGESERASGAVITLHDTTEIKTAAKALEDAYAELKYTQAQMLQREKMASVGQLAAGIAHEINNPMGFITSNLSSLDRYMSKFTAFIELQGELIHRIGDEEGIAALSKRRKELKLDYVTQDAVQLIKESLEGADRVKKIVQDLKSFSRVDEADYKHANINECLESTLNIAWNELKYKTTLHKDFGCLPLTRCFPQQLNQVFLNLLVNAAQAIESKGEISIRTREEDGSIIIDISDTGCGIPEQSLNRIFEPFYTTKEVGKGTGLGLSITYDIVKKHQGEITVISEQGKGTTFTIRLPVVDGRSA